MMNDFGHFALTKISEMATIDKREHDIILPPFVAISPLFGRTNAIACSPKSQTNVIEKEAN